MSQNELTTIESIHNLNVQLVAGTGFLAVNAPKFYLGVSQILGLQCITPAGVGANTAVITAITYANSGAVNADHSATITVASTVATDASLYRIVWVNKFLSNSATSYTA